MSKTIIGIVGKTGSGKDTVASIVKKTYGVSSVVSYTTRPMREYEEDGVQHYFVTDEQMNNIITSEDIIAYTENEVTGIRYCATVQSIFKDGNIVVYIINPDGIYWMQDSKPDDVRLITIFVDCNEDILRQRALSRGDDEKVFQKRLESERDEFEYYRDSGYYDYIINNDGSEAELNTQINRIFFEIMKKVLN